MCAGLHSVRLSGSISLRNRKSPFDVLSERERIAVGQLGRVVGKIGLSHPWVQPIPHRWHGCRVYQSGV